ncbi:segregation/condensation protein A [soil metagenome]
MARPADDVTLTPLGVIAPLPIHVESPAFTGPLGTLFLAVRDHRVDLMDVPLFPICEAYLTYLALLPETPLDEAASALSALAYLVERKAWLLLPPPEPEDEPEMWEEPLALEPPPTLEFRAALGVLESWAEERSHWYFRSAGLGSEPYELPYQLANVSATDLGLAFSRALRRVQPEDVRLAKPKRSLAEQMERVRETLSNDWATLSHLAGKDSTRLDVVYWFLALLELVRLGEAWAQSGDGEVEFRKADPTAPTVLAP